MPSSGKPLAPAFCSSTMGLGDIGGSDWVFLGWPTAWWGGFFLCSCSPPGSFEGVCKEAKAAESWRCKPAICCCAFTATWIADSCVPSAGFCQCFDRLYLFECFVSPLIHWLGGVVQPIRILDIIILQQPSELSTNCTSITFVIKPLLSFQVASKHVEALLHVICTFAFCRQATGTTATSRQATGSPGIVGIGCLCLLLGCNTAGCGMAVPGIGRSSSSQSCRDSHPKLSSTRNIPTSLSFLHPPLIPPPDWLPQNRQAKTATCLLQASWNQHKSRGKHNRVWAVVKWLQMHTFNFAKKTTSSMICTPNFTFFISSQKFFCLFNHRNYSIYLITKIFQST